MIWKDSELDKLETTHLLYIMKMILGKIENNIGSIDTIKYYGTSAIEILLEINRVLLARANKAKKARTVEEKKVLQTTCPTRVASGNRYMHAFFVEEVKVA